MPAGRPSEYTQKYCQEVDKYLESFGHGQMSLPQIEDFAEKMGKSIQCFNEWEKKYPEFGEALNKIRKRQKIQLINDGIYGGKEVNSTIVKLLLMNNHGMREKTDNETKLTLPQPLLSNLDGLPDNNSSQEAQNTSKED